ncbi:glutathione S-transferase [Pseudomonas sp. 10B1]|uniref:glutathione S-transferase family protein n=1 Tax=unclassified Pseudomonas TaxID=196821 RepID=UPI002AB44037|nr:MULTISPECIES: glutathione S-transferase [unclassified Pseudomonas]MDY7560966.1 glutathione S-transferase [Pseudomonas sp. AB6]MEA9978295.1 glutathione S-transferase [Pseudomonas sp. RTS4]MEA9995106.1 glutathione S-transferase [Pseudomonas sp. AA4]MEB0086956.1 glutathione S-transferase [Pseudomonas sp. RTI1]MEB0126777.1 glutathione S-transferase [Pseudomonas sp. CCC1.2]
MKLYFHPLSGHSHRALLFLSLLGVDHSLTEVDLLTRAQKSPEFLNINPFGQVPVLEDGDQLISDSNAILVYLAKKFGRTDWLPETALEASRVQRWLSVAAGEINRGPASARLVNVFGAKLDAVDTINRSHAILKQVEKALEGLDWIVPGLHPTVADIALYSYIARAPEGDVDLAAYPLILGWLTRVENLPGFVPFQKTSVGLTA